MSPHRFTARLVLAAVTVALVAACGGPATPPPDAAPTASPDDVVPPVAESDRMDPYIVDQGFTQWDDQGPKISFGAVVRNPNPASWAVSKVRLTATFTDAAGAVVGTSQGDPIGTILPGTDSAFVGTTIDRPAGPATGMSVQLDGVEWQNTDKVSAGVVSFADGVARPDAPGTNGHTDVLLTCAAQSTFAAEKRDGVVNVIYRDGAGSIIGGDGFAATDNGAALVIPAQATTSLEFREQAPPPQGVPNADCYYGDVASR